MEEKIAELTRFLTGVLENGIRLDSKTLDFIESSFAASTSCEVEEVLKNSDSNDMPVLEELLLFPDDTLRDGAEAILMKHEWDSHDAEILTGCLVNQEVIIEFPDDAKIKFVPSDDGITRFVERLNISRKIDKNLKLSARNLLSEKIAAKFLALIRGCDVEIIDQRADFFCRFVDISQGWNIEWDKGREFFEAVSFLLSIAGEIKSQESTYDLLSRKKQKLIEALNKAEKQRQMLEKGTIEALLMQRAVIMSIDEENTRRQISIIDRVCLAMFGRTETTLPPILETDSRTMGML